MRPVRLLLPLLVGTLHHEAGDVVSVSDQKAAELVKLGHARKEDAPGPVANPDHNPLADVIEPEPPGGVSIDPTSAVSPNVADNPGLVQLARVSGRRTRNAKATPANPDPSAPSPEAPEPGEIPADATASELES